MCLYFLKKEKPPKLGGYLIKFIRILRHRHQMARQQS
ncbi:hypothetical protein J2S74_005141 [Evansella vedderi]|uniref:Uncharacterized protein n=1 Tax=Evansella vedderi TaxID=38282 RepID=A0ABU0A3L0_9BACI|nr:hypothetical protein [Evansella vedderi]